MVSISSIEAALRLLLVLLTLALLLTACRPRSAALRRSVDGVK